MTVFDFIATGFGVLFAVKLIWLAYIGLREKPPDRGKDDVSGWGTPD